MYGNYDDDIDIVLCNSTRNRPPIASMILYVMKIKQIVIYANTIIVINDPNVDNQVQIQLQKQQIIQ